MLRKNGTTRNKSEQIKVVKSMILNVLYFILNIKMDF